jgi:putative endonuclease
MDRQQRGREAEQAACRYLENRGLRLIARNYRCRCGEIDLIMDDGDSLVFVEVRYRRHGRYGSAAETVDARKRARLTRCAQQYLQRHPAAQRRPARFDVISLDGGQGLHWIPDAFGV